MRVWSDRSNQAAAPTTPPRRFYSSSLLAVINTHLPPPFPAPIIMSSAGPEQDFSPTELAAREREEKERKAREEAEQAQLPYKWTQTINDVDVSAPIPANIKGRDIEVTLAKTKIRVAIKGQEPIVEVVLLLRSLFSIDIVQSQTKLFRVLA